MNKCFFLIGGPGSGKDIIIKNILTKLPLREYKIEQVINQINRRHIIEENIFISTNSSDLNSVAKVKSSLEGMGFETSMIYVDIKLETAKERLSDRNLSEDNIEHKYSVSKNNIPRFKQLFEYFVIFENNSSNKRGIIDVINFCNSFMFLSSDIFESKKAIDFKLLKKFSIKDKLKNQSNTNSKTTAYTSDNISFQDYPVRDPGFPTPNGGVGDITRNENVDFGGENSMPSNFSSASRTVVPMQVYSDNGGERNNQNVTVRKIKTIASTSFNKGKKRG